jgi:hypothetical protein
MHPDPDELGEDAASLARVVEIGSSLEDADFERVAPPADLWDRISARLDEEPQVPGATEAPIEVGGPTSGSPAPTPTADERAGDGVVVPLAPRRRPALWIGAAAAVAVVIAGIIGVTVTREDTRREVVASATLEVLEGPASASAELVRTDDGDRLIVTAQDMPPAPEGSHYELWLVDPEVSDPRSLGPMTGSTEIEVPSTIDPADYPVVDISLQADGQHEHSGHSLLRGTLQ